MNGGLSIMHPKQSEMIKDFQYQFDKKMAEDNLAAIEKLKAKKQALFSAV